MSANLRWDPGDRGLRPLWGCSTTSAPTASAAASDSRVSIAPSSARAAKPRPSVAASASHALSSFAALSARTAVSSRAAKMAWLSSSSQRAAARSALDLHVSAATRAWSTRPRTTSTESVPLSRWLSISSRQALARAQ